MDLIEALALLEQANDEHWTQDGSPRLDVLKELVGSTVTRADINEAAKGFSRENLVISQPDDAVDNEDVAEDCDIDSNDVEQEDVSEEEAAEVELVAARANLAEAQKRFKAAQETMDVIIVKNSDAVDSGTHSRNVKAYQEAQRKQREGNAKARAGIL